MFSQLMRISNAYFGDEEFVKDENEAMGVFNDDNGYSLMVGSYLLSHDTETRNDVIVINNATYI